MIHFYAFPIDEFPRDTDEKTVVAAYESDENDSRDLPVLKMTPEELACKINDEAFNDQEYWLMAVTSERSIDDQANDLNEKIIRKIIRTLKRYGLTQITMDESMEDYASAMWFDRHDFPVCSRVVGVRIHEKDIEIICDNECGPDVSLFASADCVGIDNRCLCDILNVIEETLSKTAVTDIVLQVGGFLDSKGNAKVRFDHKSYDHESDIPKIFLDGRNQKVEYVEIHSDVRTLCVRTEENTYLLDLDPDESMTKEYIEESLRQARVLPLMEAVYNEAATDKDLAFDMLFTC